MTELSLLDKTIRDKAVNALRQDLQNAIDRVCQSHDAQINGAVHTSKIEFIGKVVSNNSERVGNNAVRQFIGSYQKLLTEFPHLQEQPQ